MVAFADLVVISQNALASDHIRQPVLEPMSRPRRWFRQLPKDHLGECHFRVDDARSKQLGRLHVGDNTPIQALLSITPTTQRCIIAPNYTALAEPGVRIDCQSCNLFSYQPIPHLRRPAFIGHDRPGCHFNLPIAPADFFESLPHLPPIGSLFRLDQQERRGLPSHDQHEYPLLG
jgi:hypothetical protein